MKKKRENEDIYENTTAATKMRATKKLVRDKSNGYDLVNKVTLAYIKKEDIEGVERQINLKNFNPEFSDQNGKSIKEILEDWKLCESFKFDNALEPTKTPPNECDLKALSNILTTIEVNILIKEFQTTNITGETDKAFDFNC